MLQWVVQRDTGAAAKLHKVYLTTKTRHNATYMYILGLISNLVALEGKEGLCE